MAIENTDPYYKIGRKKNWGRRCEKALAA